MTTDDNESDETPTRRLIGISADEQWFALHEIITSILDKKHPRDVPDILQRYRLLSKWEVYDADETAR